MADEGNRNRNPNRRMDLNLYLGLPRRRPEPDLGSDLALNSLPVSAEMSSSHSESYPPVQQSTQIPIDRSNDPEYNPYSPSFDHVSSAVETLANEFFDDPFIHPPFLPSFVQASSTVQDSTEAVLHEGSNSNDAEYVPYSLSSYAPVSLSTPVPASESLTQPEIPHVPYIPISPTPGTHNHHHSIESSLPEITDFGPYRADTPRRIPLDHDDPVRPILLQYPEVRFRRLIDSNRRLLVRRLRETAPEAVDPDLDDFSPDIGGAFPERPVSETSIETNDGIQKTSVENLDAEELEETGSEDQNNGTANFDCNVCLDVAKEPVVTSCGHLFCWPCLYQWLHLHSDHKECPVCKGEVTESNITPIYGRGSSEMGVEKKGSEGEDSSLKIPPRPRGRRLEGFRQRIRRPHGSWRLIVDEDTQNRAEGQEEPSVQGIFNGANSRVLTRLLAAHRFQRDDNSEHVMNVGGSGSSRNINEAVLNHAENTNSLPGVLHGGGSRSTPSALARRGIGFWPRFAFYSGPSSERLAAIASDLSNVVGRMGNSRSNSGASGSARDPNPHNVRGTSETMVAADQASASSTIAVIQGDNGGPMDAPAEPSSVGLSRTLRRRRRNSVSGSLDVDGGVHHARKRRRLN
ncbi:zinc finger protein [Macleaya cordata]|uniref:E3 ubiquitin-protein ligase RMA n=1 Tax=Macleaya cordata TaxID=56857 RepID=A0A200R6W8_MACCD|nr:zinc finger protein [Macleaya cordata]